MARSRGDVSEPGVPSLTTVHLVSARWSNHPWGFGNDVYDALVELGCEVIDTDYRQSRGQLGSLLAQDCDLLLVLKGEGIPGEHMYARPGRSVLWYPDDLIATSHGKHHIDYNGWAFDIVYHISPWDAWEYKKRGVKDLRWLPLACNPKLHRKLSPWGYDRKLYDVLFVGNPHPERVKLYERLRSRFKVVWRRVYHEQMVQAINRARMVINLPIGGFKSGNIPHRIFEVLACGTLLLTNELPDFRSELFLGGKHLIYFNEDNIEELIAYYLDASHEEEREAIAVAGYKEVLAKHTVRHRVERILADAGLA